MSMHVLSCMPAGVAMIEWRPVDCDTRKPLPVSPGYIDKSAIYKGGPRPGWSWFPQSASNATLITTSGALQGLRACLRVACSAWTVSWQLLQTGNSWNLLGMQ